MLDQVSRRFADSAYIDSAGGDMTKGNAEIRERLYTWEEVSWMTGLSIQELIELFAQDVKTCADQAFPSHLDWKLVEQLADDEDHMASSEPVN